MSREERKRIGIRDREEGSEREGLQEKRGKKKTEVYKIRFWNVAGLRNKDKEFWMSPKEWDVIVVIETWLDGNGWKVMNGNYKKGYEWVVQGVVRNKGRGRAKGGMVLGVKIG